MKGWMEGRMDSTMAQRQGRAQQPRIWKMDGRRKDGWKDRQTTKTALETLAPTPLFPAHTLVSSSPQEGRWLSHPHLWPGLGGRRVKSWLLALLCGLLRLTGFAAPDLHSWVY